MSERDSCSNCSLRGDITTCKAVPCSVRDSWYVKELEQRHRKINIKLIEINDTLYGQGLQVANWHLNGSFEPMDNFFEYNDWEPEVIPAHPRSSK